MPDVGKLLNLGLIPDRQHAFAGRRINSNGAVEVGLIAWVSLTAAAYEMMMFLSNVLMGL